MHRQRGHAAPVGCGAARIIDRADRPQRSFRPENRRLLGRIEPRERADIGEAQAMQEEHGAGKIDPPDLGIGVRGPPQMLRLGPEP